MRYGLHVVCHGISLPPPIKRLVRAADRERTGMITFDFFIRALFGSPPILAYEPPSRGHARVVLLGV